MNIEKLIKNEANEKTPELFSEILDKAGAEGLIPQSEVAQYNAPKKSKSPKKSGGNVGFVLATIAAVTSLAAGLGIGLPLWIGGEGAPSDPGYGAEAPAPETPGTPITPGTPHEHVFGEWTVLTPKSCETEGLQERVCSCGEKEKEVIPMSHNYKYSYDYNQHWQVCSDCKTATEKEEHELALDDWYDGVCNGCNYHETIVEYSDTQWMVFSLEGDNNCWSFEGFKLPLSDLTHDLIRLGIPEYYESPMFPELGPLPVTMIGPEALKGESQIRYVELPSTIKSIETEAFADMPSLREMWIPEGVVHIGSQAFARCERLKEIQLPSTLDSNFGVAEDALDFSGIETLRLPPLDFPRDQNELQFLDLHYYNMPSLKKIDINGINYYYKFENNVLYYNILRYTAGSEDNGSRLVTFIGDGSDIDFTTGYTSIEDCAFKNKQLANTDLYLSQELVCIGSKVFENCNVKTIHIGAKIATAIGRYIRDDAFENANDLTDIYIECTKYDWSYLGKYVKLQSGVVVHCTDGNVVY